MSHTLRVSVKEMNTLKECLEITRVHVNETLAMMTRIGFQDTKLYEELRAEVAALDRKLWEVAPRTND